jgi:hypothetical protein
MRRYSCNYFLGKGCQGKAITELICPRKNIIKKSREISLRIKY